MERMIAPLKIQGPPEETKQDRPAAGSRNETRNDSPDFMSLLLSVFELKPQDEAPGQEAPLQDGAPRDRICSAPDLKGHPSEERLNPQDMTPAPENDASAPVMNSLSGEPASAQAEFGSEEAAVFLRDDKAGIPGSGGHHPGMESPDEDMPVWLQPDPPNTPDRAQLPQSPANGNPSSTGPHSHIPLTAVREGITSEPGFLSTGNGTGVDPNRVLEQINGKIISFIRRGGGGSRPEEQVMKIALHPESLGRIEVRISMTDNQVSTSIVTETAMAKELIDSQQQSLRSALQDQGFKMEGLMVSVGQQSSDGNRQTLFQPNSFEDRGRRETEKESEREASRSRTGPWERGITAYDTRGLINLFA